MKIHFPAIGLIAAAFIAGSSLYAQTEEYNIKLNEIRELLKPAPSDSLTTQQVKASLASRPEVWQKMVDQQQFARIAEYGVHEMANSFAQIPGLLEKVQEFSKSIIAEMERRDMAAIADAKNLLSRVGEALKNAKKAEDLDSLFVDLSKTKPDEYRSNPEVNTIFREFQQATEIVIAWQDYLIAEESGDMDSRREHLQRISSLITKTPIVPRSMVMRLIIQPRAEIAPTPGEDEGVNEKVLLDEIRQKLVESGDIAAAVAQINAIDQNSSESHQDSSFISDIRAVDTLRMLEPSMSESELFANIRRFQNRVNQNEFMLTRAIDQIALNAIARSYGIETPSVKVATPRKLLDSMATDAAANKDWKKLRRIIKSLDELSIGSSFPSGMHSAGDLFIISSIELGEAAEAREDFEAAVSSYLEASSREGHYLRREVGDAKLANLKKKSPEKIAALLVKAQERRQVAEVARRETEMQMREQFMGRRHPQDHPMRMPPAATLRPMIEEVVASFLQEKRLEQTKATEAKPAPKKPE